MKAAAATLTQLSRSGSSDSSSSLDAPLAAVPTASQAASSPTLAPSPDTEVDDDLVARLTRAGIANESAPLANSDSGLLPVERRVGRELFSRPLPAAAPPTLIPSVADRLAATGPSSKKPAGCPNRKAAAALLGTLAVASMPDGSAAATLAAAPREDLPLLNLPPRFPREHVLSNLPPSFEWPRFWSCTWQEHSGEIREARAELRPDEWHCSVADRRTMLEPSSNCMHFI